MKKTIILLGLTALIIQGCKKKEIEQCYDCEHKQYFLVEGQRVESDTPTYNVTEECGEVDMTEKHQEGYYSIQGQTKKATRVRFKRCTSRR